MKYIVEVNGERVEVDLAADGVHVDGEPVAAHLADVEGSPIHLVTVAGSLHRVAVRRGSMRGRLTLWMDGHRYEVEALDARTRTIRDLTASTSGSAGPRPLVAPMPGLIVRVEVQVGDVVGVGDPLVVMEAMKMENELRASASATVRAIHVAAGVAVEKGATLVEF